jgi:hypothetical protein
MDCLRRQSRKSQGVEWLARADRVDFSPCLDRRHHEGEHHQEDQEAVELELERKRDREAVEPDRNEPDDGHERENSVGPGHDRPRRLAKRKRTRAEERDRSRRRGIAAYHDAGSQGEHPAAYQHERDEPRTRCRRGVHVLP